jgi:hemolysin activation/secretion protein
MAEECTPCAQQQEIFIRGIVLTNNGEEIEKNSFADVQGVEIKHLKPIDYLQEHLNTYLQKPLTLDVINQIKKEILSAYAKNGQSFIAVEVPEQEISCGVIAFVVLEAKVGKVNCKGNRWFRDNYFTNRVDLKEDQTLNETELLNEIAWLNRNPFHSSQVIVAPGLRKGCCDIELSVKDRLPFRPYVGVDNTGTTFTDTTRLFAGFNWGNAFGRGDLFSYQFTSSPDFHKYISNYANYTAFLPWKHLFIAYGGYAEIHPEITTFRNEGKNGQASFRYIIPIKPLYTSFLSEGGFGFDYKTINSNLFFSESATALPLITHAVNITQFSGSYSLQNRTACHNTTFKAELFVSPFSWLPHQSSSCYAQLRPHAQPQFAYARVALGDIYKIPRDFCLSGLFRGQLASGPLLSSEQFGLGGYDTVRGYEESAYLSDHGLCLNAEVRAPSFLKKENQELYLLAFFDYGWGRNSQAETGLPSSDFLMSTGLGARCILIPHLTARFDYGFQLHDIFDDHHFGRCHFSVTASY